METTKPTLLELPEETFQHIVGYLDFKDLRSVSLSSSRGPAAADVFYLRTIKINIVNRKKLKLDLDCWTSLLRRSSFKVVHTLQVTGFMPLEKDDIGDTGTAAPETPYQHRISVVDAPPSIVNSAAEDGAWIPLAQFIGLLPALAELEFRCPNQFPPSLLEAIHSKLPSVCRLRLTNFRLRSLNEPELDPNEHAIITSPCLYGVQTTTQKFVGYKIDYTHEAILRIASTLAPNLKYVQTYHSSYTPAAAAGRPRPPWQGFSFHREKDKAPARLGCLETLDLLNPSLDLAATWKSHIDFTKLRALHLTKYRVLDGEPLAWLQWMQSCKFDGLETLDMSFQLRNASSKEYFEAFDACIRQLRPLKSISLGSILIPTIVASIALRHGSSLQSLVFRCAYKALPLEDELCILKIIGGNCHRLEYLTLNIRRSTGDSREVAIYEQLGSLSKLRNLRLNMESSRFPITQLNDNVPRSRDAEFDKFDLEVFSTATTLPGPLPRNGHVRNCFINRAIDETLARSIFNIIAANKQPCCRPLQSLTVSPVTQSFGRSGNLRELAIVEGAIGDTWMVQPNPRDGMSGQLTATCGDIELGKGLGSFREVSRNRLSSILDPSLEAVFRRVWPRRENDTGDWRKDWHSFPLSTS